MPKGAKAARSKAGNTIPMVLVTSADGEKEISGISYATLKDDMRKANRELKKTLETVDVLASDGSSESSDAEADAAATTTASTTEKESGNLAEIQEWKNSDGKAITAAIRKVDGDQVEFIMADGRALKYPLAKLSPESREKIKGLQAN